MTQSPHIIIVDDEAPAREMVGDYLKMHGFGVTLCDGGKSLRAVIETNVPDLVVLDLNMPEEDGLSIIRDLKSRINVPVIMLTATASPIDRVVGLELGADDYIAKPCELRELMARCQPRGDIVRYPHELEIVVPASRIQVNEKRPPLGMLQSNDVRHSPECGLCRIDGLCRIANRLSAARDRRHQNIRGRTSLE